MTLRPLALAVLLLAGCGGGSSSLTTTGRVAATGPVSAQVARTDMTDSLTFQPNVVDAKVGSLTLTVENAGVLPHNLVFEAAGLGRTGTVQGHSTATLRVVFGKAGTYTFVCTFHSRMRGEVVVASR